MKRIKNLLHLFHDDGTVLLFEYENRKYFMDTEPDFEIYKFMPGLDSRFLKAVEFEESSNLGNALLIKQEGCVYMDSREYLDSYDGAEEIEQGLSKKQKRFVQIVSAIGNGGLRV